MACDHFENNFLVMGNTHFYLFHPSEMALSVHGLYILPIRNKQLCLEIIDDNDKRHSVTFTGLDFVHRFQIILTLVYRS